MASKKYPNGSRWLQDGGSYLEVVEHIRNGIFKVKFKDSPVFTASTKEFSNGKVKDRNLPVVYGVGFIGYGTYIAKAGRSNHSPEYEVWRGMIRRCYDKSVSNYNRYGGKGITVCKEWHNFQNFAGWYTSQKMYGKSFHLDKDLLNMTSKEYSPKYCTLVPSCLNSLFTGGFKSIVYKRREKWVVQIQIGEKCANGKKRQSYFGEYEDREEALEVYFKNKIEHVINVANKEKDNLDNRVYDNLTDPLWIREYIILLAKEKQEEKIDE